ncbi:MAG TPA: type IV toxin-antitoxin system AbiEi family antitoxin domain-containing protein [Solirubrobacteraceae bacterium]
MATTVGGWATRNYGLVTRAQLLAAGCTAKTIEYWLKSGRLIRAHRTVYWLGYVRPDPLARAAAAVLGGGPHAALSHGSAAVLWGMGRRWPDQPEITIIRGDRRPPGVRVHRSHTMTGGDLRRHLGIRATSPARTLLDIAPRLTRPAHRLRMSSCPGRAGMACPSRRSTSGWGAIWSTSCIRPKR